MPLTILVAEDDDASRNVLCMRLRELGHRVVQAANGAEAVALTSQIAPDLLITDLSMPIMDGIEAWRLICDLVERPPPAIALTAITISDLQMICEEAGFAAYLTKPVNFPRLVSTIESLTGHQRAQAV